VDGQSRLGLVLDDVGSLACVGGRGVGRGLGICIGQGGAGLRGYVWAGVVGRCDGLNFLKGEIKESIPVYKLL